MKIVVYAPTFYPPVVDGTSIQAAREAKLLAKENEVYRLTFSVDRDINQIKDIYCNSKIERLSPIFLDSATRNHFNQLDGSHLSSRIKEINPDVLIVRGWYQLKVIEKILDNCPGQKILWHVDGLHECHSHYQKTTYYQRFLSKVCQSEITFAGLSKFDLPLLTELGISNNKTCVVLPFLKKDLFQKKKERSDLRFLSFGRFVPHKRHLFIKKQIVRLFPEKQLIFAGAADSKQSYQCIKELLHQGTQLFLNPTDDLMNFLFMNATHFLSGSMVESLGISTLEAVAANCIPLVRNVGGIKSYLPDDCMYDSDEMFADKLKKLCSLKHTENMSIKLKKLRDRLEPESVYLDLMQVLHRLIR